MTSNTRLSEEELAQNINQLSEIDAKIDELNIKRKIVKENLDLHYGFSVSKFGSKKYDKCVQFRRSTYESQDTKRMHVYLKRQGYSEEKIDEILPYERKLSKTAAKTLPEEDLKKLLSMISVTGESVSVKVVFGE